MTNTDPNEVYDARRCRTCGVPLEEHTPDCPRHAYRPAPPHAWVAEAVTRHGLEINGHKKEAKANG